MIRVGVTGGIGSGKTTVCELFAGLGIPVYDCDRRARELMTGPGAIQAAIIDLLGAEAYPAPPEANSPGNLPDREFIARKVFADKMLLASLNAIIHPAVAQDFEAWALSKTAAPYLILESAILFESRFDRFMDKTITVSAPESTRIERVINRTKSQSLEEVRQRMSNQLSDLERQQRADYTIDNAGTINDLKLKVLELDKLFRQ